MDAVPVDLRQPLFGLLRLHGIGAVARKGNAWKEFDPCVSTEDLKNMTLDDIYHRRY